LRQNRLGGGEQGHDGGCEHERLEQMTHVVFSFAKSNAHSVRSFRSYYAPIGN
jgi:hypothetical protein